MYYYISRLFSYDNTYDIFSAKFSKEDTVLKITSILVYFKIGK